MLLSLKQRDKLKSRESHVHFKLKHSSVFSERDRSCWRSGNYRSDAEDDPDLQIAVSVNGLNSADASQTAVISLNRLEGKLGLWLKYFILLLIEWIRSLLQIWLSCIRGFNRLWVRRIHLFQCFSSPFLEHIISVSSNTARQTLKTFQMCIITYHIWSNSELKPSLANKPAHRGQQAKYVQDVNLWNCNDHS